MNPIPTTQSATSSLDGNGAGDHDVPYRFGRQPRANASYPFSTRQYARLLILRGRLRAGPIEKDDPRGVHADVLPPDGVGIDSQSEHARASSPGWPPPCR